MENEIIGEKVVKIYDVENIDMPKEEVKKIVHSKGSFFDPLIMLGLESGKILVFGHESDCCEEVSLKEVSGGGLDDLIGQEIKEFYLSKKEEGSDPDPKKKNDSFTWTFYIIRTQKATLTISFLGESNGYYSEEVDVILFDENLKIEKVLNWNTCHVCGEGVEPKYVENCEKCGKIVCGDCLSGRDHICFICRPAEK